MRGGCKRRDGWVGVEKKRKGRKGRKEGKERKEGGKRKKRTNKTEKAEKKRPTPIHSVAVLMDMGAIASPRCRRAVFVPHLFCLAALCKWLWASVWCGYMNGCIDGRGSMLGATKMMPTISTLTSSWVHSLQHWFLLHCITMRMCHMPEQDSKCHITKFIRRFPSVFLFLPRGWMDEMDATLHKRKGTPLHHLPLVGAMEKEANGGSLFPCLIWIPGRNWCTIGVWCRT